MLRGEWGQMSQDKKIWDIANQAIKETIRTNNPKSILDLVTGKLLDTREEFWNLLHSHEQDWFRENARAIPHIVTHQVLSGILHVVTINRSGINYYRIHKKIDADYATVQRNVKKLEKIKLLYCIYPVKGINNQVSIYISNEYSRVVNFLYIIIQNYYGMALDIMFDKDTNRQGQKIKKYRENKK